MEKRNKHENKRKAAVGGGGGGGGGGTASSNLAEELFGPKDPSPSSSSSASLFAFLFPRLSTTRRVGSNSSGMTGPWKHQDLGHAPYQRPDEMMSTEEGSSIYQNVASESSHYFSSSIYYGGRETYSPMTQPSFYHPPPQYRGEDDPDERISRGDWWQGSYYY